MKYGEKLIALFTICTIAFGCSVSSKVPQPVDLSFKVKGVSDTTCLLAYHYGNSQYIEDTLQVDKNGNIKYHIDSVNGGIYMLVFPSLKNNYFEFILSGYEPKVTMQTDSRSLTELMEVTASEENKKFYEDMRFLTTMKKKSDRLGRLMEVHKDKDDSTKSIRAQIRKLDKEVKDERVEFIRENPDLFYTKVLNAMRDLEIPDAPKDEEGNVIDTTYRYRYYKSQFFKHFDLGDDRLIRTPVFHSKLKQYIKEVIPQIPDSLITASDRLLAACKPAPESFKYALVWLLNTHAKSKIMGMDAVYVHLVDEYYAKGAADWMDETQLYRIMDDARTLRPLLIGKRAPNMRLIDLNNKVRDLYQLDARFTLVYIWDPDCGHCKKETPKLWTMYRDSLKAKGLEVYAVSTVNVEEKKKWLDFLDKHKMYDWINVGDMYHQTDFRNNYDVSATPVVFLLDRTKKIIAKRLKIEQLPDFLDHAIQQEVRKSKG